MRFVHPLRVRYHECDLQGVVFNANYFAYFDVALTELMRVTLGSYQALRDGGLDLLVVEATARFYAPARFDEEIDVAFVPETLGRSSMVSAIDISRAGEQLVRGRMVHVFVDVDSQAKCPIPDYVRQALAPWTEQACSS